MSSKPTGPLLWQPYQPAVHKPCVRVRLLRRDTTVSAWLAFKTITTLFGFISGNRCMKAEAVQGSRLPLQPLTDVFRSPPPSISCPGLFFGRGHEAVLNAQDDEGILTAACLLLQKLA